jgi:hypothetical protein
VQHKETYNDKRLNERLNLALQILLIDHKGETKNISASGVYFEVITKNRDAFFPGTIITVQIGLVITTPGLEGRGVKITGRGFVVRNDIKDVTSRGNRLGIALKFDEKLDILVD